MGASPEGTLRQYRPLNLGGMRSTFNVVVVGHGMVGLTGYTDHWDRGLLALPGNDYRDDDAVELRLGSRVATIDRAGRKNGVDGRWRLRCLRRAGAGHRFVSVRTSGAGP